MGENSRFDFCSKCGALAKDGVCQSCGYQNPEIIQLLAAENAQPTAENIQPTADQPVQEQVAAEQPVSQTQPEAQSTAQEQFQGQFSGQIYGQTMNSTQQPVQMQGYYGQQPVDQQSTAQSQGYYGQQSTGQAQSYYAQQPTGPAQTYYSQQSTVQSQGYYTQQPTGQAQGYYTQQSAGQTQGYYGQQPAGQAQGYYGQQSTSQPQGYYTQQQAGQTQGYYGQQSAGQTQDYYTQQQTSQTQGYYAQQTGQVQQPYGSYAPAIPSEAADKKTKKGTVAVLCVVLGIVLLAVIILILVALYNLQNGSKGDSRLDRDRDEETSEVVKDDETEDDSHGVVDSNPVDGNPANSYTYKYLFEDVTSDNWNEEGQDDSLSYYSGPYNALRNDLSYEVSFARESYYVLEDALILIAVEYPQIASDDIPHVDRINTNLRDDYEFYYQTFEDSFKPLVKSTDDIYYCVVDSYVTYMDEDILSIVFKETVYLSLQNDPFQDLYFYCVNIDLHTGEIMDNTTILNVDENFVATLRDRELLENESRLLGNYTDEEIINMLKDDGDLVLFYTPMGMEVGLNMSEEGHVIYFMYDDYQQYLNSF